MTCLKLNAEALYDFPNWLYFISSWFQLILSKNEMIAIFISFKISIKRINTYMYITVIIVNSQSACFTVVYLRSYICIFLK